MAHWSEHLDKGEVREITAPAAPDLAAFALQRCGTLAEELAARCRKWCADEGRAPQSALEIVAGLALAIAAEGVRDEALLHQELLARCRQYDTPDGLLGVEAAALQMLAFLESGPLTGRSSL